MQAQDIKAKLRPGTNFAAIEYETEVKTAAAHKHLTVKKLVHANVQVFSGIKDWDLYAKQVRRDSGEDHFQSSENYFTHEPDCFSIVRNRKNDRLYLYAIFNSVQSATFTIDGAPATRQQVAELLTPSARKRFDDISGKVYNVTNDVEHTITVRTIALENIIDLRT